MKTEIPGKRVTLRLVAMLISGAVGFYFILVVAVNVIVWRHRDHINEQRLKILQADGILRCRIVGISPWREKEEINADAAGTTHGIGPGPTSVTRIFSLNDADPANVVDAFTVCAQSNGWTLATQPYVALSGTKSFPDGWTEYLNIYIVKHPPFTDHPIIQVSLITNPI